MTSRPKGGPLEKNFFKTCSYDFKMIVLMKENVFSYFKTIWSMYWKIFKTGGKKFKGWPQDQRGDHWKKIFLKHVFMIWKWLFWWKETFFHILKQFEAYWKIFKTAEKNLRGDLRTKGGTIGKNFFKTCFYDLKMIVLMKENVFSYFKTIWSIFEKFSKLAEKNLRGDLRTKGGTIGKKFFSKHVFMIWKWLFWWKKTFFIFKAIRSI